MHFTPPYTRYIFNVFLAFPKIRQWDPAPPFGGKVKALLDWDGFKLVEAPLFIPSITAFARIVVVAAFLRDICNTNLLRQIIFVLRHSMVRHPFCPSVLGGNREIAV